MQIYKFDCNGHNAPAYGCNKPGDNSGEYVRVDDVVAWLISQRNNIPATGVEMAGGFKYALKHGDT